MPIDTSMYTNYRAPDMAGAFQDGMRMRDMYKQRQENDAVKGAFANNMMTNAQGEKYLNQKGVMADLMAASPEKGLQYQKQMREDAAAAQKTKIEKFQNEANLVARSFGAVKDQASYDDALGFLSKQGVDVSKLPRQHDPGLVNRYRMQAMSVTEQATQARQQQEFELKKQELGIKRGEAGGKHQDTALQQTSSLLESARGNPEVSQALKDRYAAKKADSLFSRYKDPNQMNSQETQLYATEIAKMASGGVPSIHELQGLNPSTIPSDLSQAAQKFANHPVPANAGEFMKRYKAYSDALKGDANEVIKSKFHRVIESRKKQLGPDNYSTLKTQYLDPLDADASGPAGAPQVLKTHEIEW